MAYKCKITECPKCGFKEFYRKGTVSGPYTVYYGFDGKPVDNTHLHDRIRYKERKTCYCAGCDYRLGNIVVEDSTDVLI